MTTQLLPPMVQFLCRGVPKPINPIASGPVYQTSLDVAEIGSIDLVCFATNSYQERPANASTMNTASKSCMSLFHVDFFRYGGLSNNPIMPQMDRDDTLWIKKRKVHTWKVQSISWLSGTTAAKYKTCMAMSSASRGGIARLFQKASSSKARESSNFGNKQACPLIDRNTGQQELDYNYLKSGAHFLLWQKTAFSAASNFWKKDTALGTKLPNSRNGACKAYWHSFLL